MKKFLLPCFIFCFCLFQISATAQTKQKLDQKIFNDSIAPYFWTARDSATKADTGFDFSTDSVTVIRINTAAGFVANTCAYKLEIKNNYFKATPGACMHPLPGKIFYYGYLTSDRKLHILTSEKKLELNDGLLAVKGWMVFDVLR